MTRLAVVGDDAAVARIRRLGADLDVIAAADVVLEMGPEAGEEGGRITALGPPEAIAAQAGSHTGRFLASRLAGRVDAAAGAGGPRRKGARKRVTEAG